LINGPKILEKARPPHNSGFIASLRLSFAAIDSTVNSPTWRRRKMSVTLINPFEVPEGKEEEALGFWDRVADYMRKQPGFISTLLHKPVVPWARFHFINVAEWQSAEHFEIAINNGEFKQLTDPYMEVFPHYPGLYQVVRT
jgi:heme oxygenase (mycobilin-producing)